MRKLALVQLKHLITEMVPLSPALEVTDRNALLKGLKTAFGSHNDLVPASWLIVERVPADQKLKWVTDGESAVELPEDNVNLLSIIPGARSVLDMIDRGGPALSTYRFIWFEEETLWPKSFLLIEKNGVPVLRILPATCIEKLRRGIESEVKRFADECRSVQHVDHEDFMSVFRMGQMDLELFDFQERLKVAR